MQPISPALAAPGCNAGFDQPLPAPETASGKTPGLLQQGQKPISDSMWSQVPAVQVMAFRLLNRLSSEGWARDLVDMMYLDDETREWAESELSSEESTAPTLDSNGSVLNAGDTVTLIKDLPVKGAGFTAKRGTAVRNISLTGNPEQIEGRVNGVRIVLLTKYLKKA